MNDLTAFLAARLDEDERPVVTERMRREIAAKRARLALMIETTAEMDRLLGDKAAGEVEQAMAIGRARGATVAAKHDAAIWSDRPDYRPEWKP